MARSGCGRAPPPACGRRAARRPRGHGDTERVEGVPAGYGLLVARLWGTRLRCWWHDEAGAEVPEYVLVVAIVAMLAVGGLVALKGGITTTLGDITNCLSGVAGGSSSTCG